MDRSFINKDGVGSIPALLTSKKAFDTVIHTGIKIKLLENGIGYHFYNIIKSMYSQSKSCIRLNNTLTDFLVTMLE
jgi:hypothetical protein